MEYSQDNGHKYARIEYERRFLVDPEGKWPRHRGVEILDRYLDCGRLRVRRMRHSNGDCVYKLTKKYGSDSPYAQPIVTAYLDEQEHAALMGLPGREVAKTRYHDEKASCGVDVFNGRLKGLILCEIEAPSLEELIAIEPPSYATREVTEDSRFTGWSLSQPSGYEIIRELRWQRTVAAILENSAVSSLVSPDEAQRALASTPDAADWVIDEFLVGLVVSNSIRGGEVCDTGRVIDDHIGQLNAIRFHDPQ